MGETNSIIRASAGTGKTYALATRFIRLMSEDDVKPETIVALTFSRAAAQEIYTKILGLLCQGEHAKLLRQVVETQHIGTIATIDSFILKVVRNFPKEMGVQNAISVLDPIEENAAVDDAVKSALSKTDGADADIAKAFVMAQKGEYARQCLGAIGNILVGQGWRNFVLSHPECIDKEHGGKNRWTVASMAEKLGVDLASVCPDLSMIPFNDVGRKNAISPEETFVTLARNYDGTKGLLDISDSVKSLMRFFWTNPEATTYDYKYFKDFTLDCGSEGAAAIRGAIRHMMNVYLKRQLEIVEAKIRLVEAVEGEYERMTRRMGKLTFADFTKYSAEEEFSQRGIALKNIEFRFDSKFDHWALDEFQDTSELQWRCLKELVKNVADEGHAGGGRTAMVVGDMKQSIYTWRGASAQPFEDVASWKAFEGLERDLCESYRYGPNITDFINKVFGPENIKVGDEIPAVCANAVEAWQRGWREHVSHQASDYVKVIVAAKDDDDEEDDEILPALYAEVSKLWARHRDEHSVDTVGILVRNNADGLKVAEYLRKKGIADVVWEGMSPCGDDPVVQAVLALLKLAEHPSDSAAWQTVSELIDIRSVLLPECSDVSAASAGVARLLAQQGLSRTLKEWCEQLRADVRMRPDGLTNDKLRRLIELAVAFESRTSGDGSMLAFADFVAKSGQREIAASSEVIRILTIHRSKGLGFDHVFVPLFEGERAKSAMDAPKGSTPLFDGGDWVLSHLQKGSEQFNARTKSAYEEMCGERFAESLRTYYVALTRAKKSMVVIFPEEKKKGDGGQGHHGLLMRDLIRSAVGNDLPYEVGTLPSLKPQPEKADDGEKAKPGDKSGHTAWSAGETELAVRRRSPSQAVGVSSGGRKAADLFDADFGDAAQKGIDAHAAYAKIEWIDSEAPQNDCERQILATDFREAFVKPAPEATVWRERSYEIYSPQPPTPNPQPPIWETGQFDRVVFTGEGGNRSAVIYDFKTNALHAGETTEAFANRMVEVYRLQMASYRQALHRLTQIPLERIETRLLLESTGQSVSV